MYLTRLTLKDRANVHAVVARLGSAYQEHKMLWKVFEPDPKAKRDFLFRRDMRFGRIRYFLLSGRPPVNSMGLWDIDRPKEFRPRVRRGQALAFSLRVNPAICRDGKHHDVVMDCKRRMGWSEMVESERPPLQQIIYEAGTAWLRQRAVQFGFEVDPKYLRIDGYQQQRARTRGRTIYFSMLDYSGILTVADPDTFTERLKRGIGRAKAFGCGLLLIRPV